VARRQNRQRRTCKRCGAEFWPRHAKQTYCSFACGKHAPPKSGARPATRKVARPPYPQLQREIHALGWEGVGRRYGVTGNAVRKWVRQYERELVESDEGLAA
jgi:hypothetical protein